MVNSLFNLGIQVNKDNSSNGFENTKIFILIKEAINKKAKKYMN